MHEYTPEHPDVAYIMRYGEPRRYSDNKYRPACPYCGDSVLPGELIYGGMHRECFLQLLTEELADERLDEIAAALGYYPEVG